MRLEESKQKFYTFEARYRAWQEKCVDECNRIYNTNFPYSYIDREINGLSFEVCENGSIHFGNWYEGLPKWED